METYDDPATEVLCDLEGPLGNEEPEDSLATGENGEESTEKGGCEDDEDGGDSEARPGMRVVGSAAIVAVISGVQSVRTHGC